MSKRSKAARAPPGAGAGVKRDKRFAATPGFLAGGDLHGYQVEGVNWLCHAWDRRQHVILADEMGLGAAVGAHAGHHRLPACPPCQPPLAVALRSGILAVARIACMDGTSEHVCHWAAVSDSSQVSCARARAQGRPFRRSHCWLRCSAPHTLRGSAPTAQSVLQPASSCRAQLTLCRPSCTRLLWRIPGMHHRAGRRRGRADRCSAARSAEGVAKPHLVVVPLSTARNWLREFQAWAPQLNVASFSGNQVGGCARLP